MAPQAHDGGTKFTANEHFYSAMDLPRCDAAATNAAANVSSVGCSRHALKIVVTSSLDAAMILWLPGNGAGTAQGPADALAWDPDSQSDSGLASSKRQSVGVPAAGDEAARLHGAACDGGGAPGSRAGLRFMARW